MTDKAPRANQLASCARYMFSRRRGDCYYYASAMAYIARVLGYDARVVVWSGYCKRTVCRLISAWMVRGEVRKILENAGLQYAAGAYRQESVPCHKKAVSVSAEM